MVWPFRTRSHKQTYPERACLGFLRKTEQCGSDFYKILKYFTSFVTPRLVGHPRDVPRIKTRMRGAPRSHYESTRFKFFRFELNDVTPSGLFTRRPRFYHSPRVAGPPKDPSLRRSKIGPQRLGQDDERWADAS